MQNVFLVVKPCFTQKPARVSGFWVRVLTLDPTRDSGSTLDPSQACHGLGKGTEANSGKIDTDVNSSQDLAHGPNSIIILPVAEYCVNAIV
jgi:hypothetical protein